MQTHPNEHCTTSKQHRLATAACRTSSCSIAPVLWGCHHAAQGQALCDVASHSVHIVQARSSIMLPHVSLPGMEALFTLVSESCTRVIHTLQPYIFQMSQRELYKKQRVEHHTYALVSSCACCASLSYCAWPLTSCQILLVVHDVTLNILVSMLALLQCTCRKFQLQRSGS